MHHVEVVSQVSIFYMVCSMPNRTGSGLHVSDLLENLRIDRLTNNEKTQNLKFFRAFVTSENT